MDKRATETLYDAIVQAFPERSVRIHKEYGFDIDKGIRRWVDILVEHPEWGLYVIEVKGYGIDNIADIRKKYWTIEQGSRPVYEPFQRGTTLLQGMMSSLLRNNRPTPPRLHVMVGLPFVSREGFAQRQRRKNALLNSSIILQDDLEPERLRAKLQDAPALPQSELIVQGQYHEATRSVKDDYRIFISYRREDSKWAAGRIADRLKTEFGDNFVFFDTRDTGAGTRWRQQIQTRLERSSIVLAVIGDRWLTVDFPDSGKRRLDDPDDVLKFELVYALKNLKVVPIILENVRRPERRHLPEELQDLPELQDLSVSADYFDRDMREVIDEILNLLQI